MQFMDDIVPLAAMNAQTLTSLRRWRSIYRPEGMEGWVIHDSARPEVEPGPAAGVRGECVTARPSAE